MHIYLLICLQAIIIAGCQSTFSGLGSSVIDGAKKDGRMDTIGANLAQGLVNGLTSDANKEKIDSLITSLGNSLKKSADSIIVLFGGKIISIRDSLIGEYLLSHAAALRDTLTGEKLKVNLGSIRDELLGRQTKKKLEKLIAGAIHEVLSPATRDKITRLLDTVSNAANIRISMIIDTALEHITKGAGKIETDAKTNISWLQKNVTGFLITASALIVATTGLLIYFLRKKNKFSHVANLLTYQIHSMKNDNEFKTLTDKISDQAKRENIEPFLREILKGKGILGRRQGNPYYQNKQT